MALVTTPRLLGRRLRITIDDEPLVVAGEDDQLRVKFAITRTDTDEPDRADVLVTNASLDTIKKAESAWRLTNTDPFSPVFGRAIPANLKIFAGYRDLGLSGLDELLFTGDLVDTANAPRVGSTETGLLMKAGDGLDGLQNGFMQQSFSGVTLDKIMKAAALAMGLTFAADAEKSIGAALVEADVKSTPHGFMAEGRASSVMTDMADTVGLKWWVQDNQLQMVQKFKPYSDFALSLSAQTGLIDSPVFKANGDVEFQALLDPRLKPGRQLQIEGAPAKTYRLDAAQYRGDTGGGEWYVTGKAAESFAGVSDAAFRRLVGGLGA